MKIGIKHVKASIQNKSLHNDDIEFAKVVECKHITVIMYFAHNNISRKWDERETAISLPCLNERYST